MSTRFASIDPRLAECRHPDDGFQLPTAVEIFHLDQTTIETEYYQPPLRITRVLLPEQTANSSCVEVFQFLLEHYRLLMPREIGALIDEAQTIYSIAQEVHVCLQRAMDTWDVEDRLDALASAQASQDGLEGVDVVEAVGEQLITELREQEEEPESW